MELSKLHDSKEGPHLLMPSCLIDALQQNPLAEGDVRTTLAEDNQHDLLHALAAVPDPRSPRGMRYRLSSLLAVAVCAVLAGATTFAAIADWAADLDPPARHRLGFNGPIPVGTTVWRLLVRLDAQVLQAVLTGWLRSRVTPAPPAAPARVARMSSRSTASCCAERTCPTVGRCICCRPTTPVPDWCWPRSRSTPSPTKSPRSLRC